MKLRQRGSDRLRQKLSLRLIVALSLCTVVISISAFFYLNTGTVKQAKAAVSYYTIKNGDWDKKIWSTVSNSGPTCNCDPGPNYNGPGIYIAHDVRNDHYNPLNYSGGGTISILSGGIFTVNTELVISASTLNITGGGQMVVNGKLTISGGSQVVIGAGDSLKVNGNLDINGGSNVTATNGFFRVIGNVNMSGGSNVCGSGSLTYSGALTGTTWCNNPGNGYLPIKLISFTAKREGNDTRFLWSTASEENNDYFTIERTNDGNGFEELLKIKGAGNSQSILNYSAIDYNTYKKVCYYRLKQTDYDGHFSYSNVIVVNNDNINNSDAITIESVSPNPFTNNFELKYIASSKCIAEVKIFNNTGICIFKENVTANKGLNHYSFFDNMGLRGGLYYVNLFYNGRNVTKLVVKS